MFLPFCSVPLVLTLSSILAWRRVVNRAPRPTVQRGLQAVVLATALSLPAICLLALLFFMPFILYSSNRAAAVLGLAIFALVPLGQSLRFFPTLLIAGAALRHKAAFTAHLMSHTSVRGSLKHFL